jgi:hypothetical protein
VIAVAFAILMRLRVAPPSQKEVSSVGIYGEVSQPGCYRIPASSVTLKDALSKYGDAQGCFVGSRTVVIVRKNNEVSNYRVPDSLVAALRFGEEVSNVPDVVLRDGDLVYVPAREEAVILDDSAARYVLFDPSPHTTYRLKTKNSTEWERGRTSDDAIPSIRQALESIQRNSKQDMVPGGRYLVIPNGLARLKTPDLRREGAAQMAYSLKPNLSKGSEYLKPFLSDGSTELQDGDIAICEGELFDTVLATCKAVFGEIDDTKDSSIGEVLPVTSEVGVKGKPSPTDVSSASIALGRFYAPEGDFPFPQGKSKSTEASQAVLNLFAARLFPTWPTYEKTPLQSGVELGRISQNEVFFFGPTSSTPNAPVSSLNLMTGADFKASLDPTNAPRFRAMRAVYRRYGLDQSNVYLYGSAGDAAKKKSKDENPMDRLMRARYLVALTDIGKDPDPLGARSAKYVCFPNLFSRRASNFELVPLLDSRSDSNELFVKTSYAIEKIWPRDRTSYYNSKDRPTATLIVRLILESK